MNNYTGRVRNWQTSVTDSLTASDAGERGRAWLGRVGKGVAGRGGAGGQWPFMICLGNVLKKLSSCSLRSSGRSSLRFASSMSP